MNDMTAGELLRLIDHPWATTKDIMKIGCVGETRALKIKNNICKEYDDEGYVLPRNKVPMEEVIKYFRINIDFLKKISRERIDDNGK